MKCIKTFEISSFSSGKIKTLIACKKQYLLLEFNIITKFLMFRMKYIIGVVYVMIDTYNHFIIPMRYQSYSFICYLIIQVYLFLSIKLLFLTSSEIFKVYEEYHTA